MSEYNKLVYIAGPFRADTLFEIEKNVMRAREYAAAVWKAGAVGVCPHSNTGFSFQGLAPDDAWLKGDLEILRRCDAIVMIPGWRSSSGSRVENDFAINRLQRDNPEFRIFDCQPKKGTEFSISPGMIIDPIKAWLESIDGHNGR